MPNQAFWQFRCPECGFGHREFGHLLSDHEIYCVVCVDEDGRYVRLHRWEAEEAAEAAKTD